MPQAHRDVGFASVGAASAVPGPASLGGAAETAGLLVVVVSVACISLHS